MVVQQVSVHQDEDQQQAHARGHQSNRDGVVIHHHDARYQESSQWLDGPQQVVMVGRYHEGAGLLLLLGSFILGTLTLTDRHTGYCRDLLFCDVERVNQAPFCEGG